jgi:hypothetical protein
MIEMFEPSKSDADVFKDAEKKLYKIIVRYVNTYANTEFLPNFEISSIPEDSDVEVDYVKPEVVQSEEEKLASIKQRLELGLIDDTDAIAQDRGISREAAEAIEERMKEDMREDLMSGSGSSTTILNGAQVTALELLVEKVSQGLIPADSARETIVVGFGLTTEQAEKIVAPARAFTPAVKVEGVKL